MRKFLIHLLMLVMLMPGLACGPFMSASKAHAATVQMKGMTHCHDTGLDKDSGSKKISDNDSLMLFKDCSKADLYGADHVSLKKPDTAKMLFVAWSDIVLSPVFTPADFNDVRAPPPDWPDISQTRPSILLTAQRFRE